MIILVVRLFFRWVFLVCSVIVLAKCTMSVDRLIKCCVCDLFLVNLLLAFYYVPFLVGLQ